jgi:hypothetical protein
MVMAVDLLLAGEATGRDLAVATKITVFFRKSQLN